MLQTLKILKTKLGSTTFHSVVQFSLIVDNDHTIENRHEHREIMWANKNHTAKFYNSFLSTKMTTTGLVMAE